MDEVKANASSQFSYKSCKVVLLIVKVKVCKTKCLAVKEALQIKLVSQIKGSCNLGKNFAQLKG